MMFNIHSPSFIKIGKKMLDSNWPLFVSSDPTLFHIQLIINPLSTKTFFFNFQLKIGIMVTLGRKLILWVQKELALSQNCKHFLIGPNFFHFCNDLKVNLQFYLTREKCSKKISYLSFFHSQFLEIQLLSYLKNLTYCLLSKKLCLCQFLPKK